VKDVKAELGKLLLREDEHHNVLYTFQNKTSKKLTYHMITKDEPKRNVFHLESHQEFTEHFTIQFNWVIMEGENLIAVYNPKKNLAQDIHVILCTTNPNTTEEILKVQFKLKDPIAFDPKTRPEDFRIVVEEDNRERTFAEKYLNLEKFDQLLKITNSDAKSWEKIGNFKNKRCTWSGELGSHNFEIEHMEFTFENQVKGNGQWKGEAYTIEGKITGKGYLDINFVFTHSKMRFGLRGNPGKTNMFDGSYTVVEDDRVKHELTV